MYHTTFEKKVFEAPVTLGTTLGRWAIFHQIPVIKISRAVGATRQSIYTWMKGGEVFVAYRPAVTKTINCMQSASSTEEAWSKICQEFNLSN